VEYQAILNECEIKKKIYKKKMTTTSPTTVVKTTLVAPKRIVKRTIIRKKRAGGGDYDDDDDGGTSTATKIIFFLAFAGIVYAYYRYRKYVKEKEKEGTKADTIVPEKPVVPDLPSNVKEGDVLRCADSLAVYKIQNKKKRWIVSARAYPNFGTEQRPGSFCTELAKIPAGQDLSALTAVGLENGTFVRCATDEKVYFLQGDNKRHVKSVDLIRPPGSIPPDKSCAILNSIPDGAPLVNASDANSSGGSEGDWAPMYTDSLFPGNYLDNNKRSYMASFGRKCYAIIDEFGVVKIYKGRSPATPGELVSQSEKTGGPKDNYFLSIQTDGNGVEYRKAKNSSEGGSLWWYTESASTSEARTSWVPGTLRLQLNDDCRFGIEVQHEDYGGNRRKQLYWATPPIQSGVVVTWALHPANNR
jgi:hypothetical protein